jgi:V8-like Glu-specific endopeptidase
MRSLRNAIIGILLMGGGFASLAAGWSQEAEAASDPAPVGKLNITFPDMTTHHCTGVFVRDNVVLTAAHCVQQNGTTVRYTLSGFVRYSGASFTIDSSCMKVPPEWQTVTDPYLRTRYDYAFIRTTTNTGAGNKTSIFTGNVTAQRTDILGYPANSTLATISDQAIDSDVLHEKLGYVKTSETDFTVGMSGGPWLDTSNNKVLAISSSYKPMIYNDSYIQIYGPVFQSSDNDLANAVAAGCP